MDTPQREDDALFRYQLIAPLLDPDLQRGDQAQQLKEIAGQEHPHPVRGRVRRSVASLKRYLRRYRKTGHGQSKVHALQRKERADKGGTRRLRPEILELAVQLRKEVPERSVAQVIHLMELQGAIAPGEVSRPTLDRHLRARGCSRTAVQAGTKGFRRWQRDRCRCQCKTGHFRAWKCGSSPSFVQDDHDRARTCFGPEGRWRR